MSKKHKSNRKPQPLAKKAAVLPPVIKAKNEPRDVRPVQKTVMPPPAPVAQVEPVPAPQERDAALPFWARMPFAVMDFWMSRTARGDKV